jgi:uroporphyrinogen decarboxylase
MIVTSKERMTSAERMQAVAQGRRPDRVPFLPFANGFCAKITGYDVADVYRDPEKSLRIQLLTKEILGHDGSPQFTYASMGAWEFGGQIKYPDGDYAHAPSVTKRPISKPEDVKTLAVPNVETAGFYPMLIAFADRVSGMGLPVTFKLGTPFTVAGSIMGEDLMLRWLLKYPELVHEVLGKVTTFLVNVARFFADRYGPDRVTPFEGAPTEANQVISPKQFETFALPYLIDYHRQVLDLGVKRFTTHVCGEQNANLELWKQVPMGEGGVMSFGQEVDLDRAIEVLGDAVVIAGNVNTTTLQWGSPGEVYEATRQAVMKGRKAPRGYILMPGCELPPSTPFANIYYLRKALNDFGFYD